MKQTRKERKEQEKKILAEMDEAMQAESNASEEAEAPKGKVFGIFKDKTPEKIHCYRCKTLMENGVCPTCGFRTYVPIPDKKQKKIRLIVGGVCLAVFIILFAWLQIAS